jgi:hypothetical protein
MKFGKPTYVAEQKIYSSQITDGFRCEVMREANTFTPALESFLPSMKFTLTQAIIQNTKGWFTKPLTESWLADRIQILYPIEDLSADFEGTLIWEGKSLVISKDKFIFGCELVEKKGLEKVMIEFPEDEPPVRRKEPLTKEQFKQLVLRERERAGRALFRAERLTQEYCQLYGEDTDWEESDSEEEN